MKQLTKVIIVTLLILLSCALLIKPTINSINYGIDLQGGFEILYNIKPLVKGDKLSQTDLDNTYSAVVNRIDTLGVSEPVITFEGDNLLRIQLPGVSNEEEARNRISTTAVLTFRDTNDKLLMTSEILGRNGASLTQNTTGLGYLVKLDIDDTTLFHDTTADIAKRSNDENKMVIWLDFDEETDSYQNEKEICGRGSKKCISAPYVNEALTGNSVVIEGNFTKDSALELIDLINSGSLPTKLTEESTPRSVSASFGEETINKTGIAGIITFALISIILIYKYRISGLLGSLCLFVYAVVVFYLFNAIDGVLTLTGIAALVLGIGMAVDSIIISNERVKDEIDKGKKLSVAFKDGNKESIVAIIDANITTLIAGIILYIFGESQVRGFATMLIITIIVTILTTVVLYRLLQKSYINTKIFNDKTKLLFGKSTRKNQFDFNKNAKYAIFTSLGIIIVGIVFMLINGINFGVDFTGGTNINLSSSEKINFDKVVDVVKNHEVTAYNTYMGSDKEGYIKIKDVLDKDEEIEIKSELEKQGIETSMYEISTLVTENLSKNAVKALLYSILAIVVYIIIRFNFNYAITGILMLIHDVLIILSIFVIFKIEFNFILVAALLTIIGYSINDTIVVFDKIRENKKKIYGKRKKIGKEELINLINTSSRETINRNVWTSITTIVAVVALLCVGLSDIFTFNVAILIGLIAGSVSSLIIGSKIWLILENRSLQKPDEDDDEVEELKIKGINS